MRRLLILIALVLAAFGVGLLVVTGRQARPAPLGSSPRFIQAVPDIACVGVTRGDDGQLRAKLVWHRWDNPIGEFRVGESLSHGKPAPLEFRIIDIVEKVTPAHSLQPPMRGESYCVIGDGRKRFIILPETQPATWR